MKEQFTWTNLLAEIARWFVIIIFLIPTADVWGLPRIITVLNEFLLYLPNVFVAAIIALVGFVFARLSHDVILASTKGIDPQTSSAIASVTKWAVSVFVSWLFWVSWALQQILLEYSLRVLLLCWRLPEELPFGLGGQGAAKDVIEGIRKKLK